MSKLEECPYCESEDLGDEWVTKNRILKQYCNDCSWKGEPRIPEIIPIETTKWGHHYNAGWHYNIFDKYGHVLITSRGYDSKNEAVDNLKSDLKRYGKDPYKPCTGVIWPGSVEVEGEVFANE